MTETSDLQNCTQPLEACDPVQASQAKVSWAGFVQGSYARCLLLLWALNFNVQVVCSHRGDNVD